MQDEVTYSGIPVSGDRRKEARRQSDRQGKYDRRKNRCIHCHEFQAENTVQGHCQLHQTTVLSDAFACPQFSPVQPEIKK